MEKIFKWLLIIVEPILFFILILSFPQIQSEVKILFKHLFNTNQDVGYYILKFFGLFILFVATIITIKYANNRYNKNNILEYKIIISFAVIVKIVIIFELIKLIFYNHYGLINALSKIKPLGYTLGGLIAVIGIYVSFLRFKETEKQVKQSEKQLEQSKKQHHKDLTETRYNNSITLLNSKSSAVRLGGVASFVSLTKRKIKDYENDENKQIEYLNNNIEILLHHLHNVYEQELEQNKKEQTSREIALTLKYICKLTEELYKFYKLDKLDKLDKLYKLDTLDTLDALDALDKLDKVTEKIDIKIPLNKIEINFNIYNVTFGEELKDVRFSEKLEYVTFGEKLKNVTFGEELKDVRFVKDLKE